MNDFKIGSLVRRKTFRGALGVLHTPRFYGVITRIDAEGQFQVTFITANGQTFKQFLVANELNLLY